MSDKIVFLASLSEGQWLKIDRDGAGKIRLDFDAQQLASVIRLMGLAEKPIRITAEPGQ